MKKLQAKPFRGLLQLLASYLNNLSRRHSLLVCPVLFECFDHNRSRSTSNPCCCHISTRVCLLSILLWTPYPFFFLGFLEGGGSAGPVLADCSDSSACDCDAWDCLLLTFSISASSFSPSSFFFWLPFFHHHSFFSKIVWYPFCLEKNHCSWFCFYFMQVGRLNPTAITGSSSAHRHWRRVRLWLT